jgi:hypothetical protein
MKERKKPVARRFCFVQNLELTGFVEVLESLKSRRVHRVDSEDVKYHLTLDQSFTLAHWFKLAKTEGVFTEKPNQDVYPDGHQWSVDEMISMKSEPDLKD